LAKFERYHKSNPELFVIDPKSRRYSFNDVDANEREAFLDPRKRR
jgi:hypothetical protein